MLNKKSVDPQLQKFQEILWEKLNQEVLHSLLPNTKVVLKLHQKRHISTLIHNWNLNQTIKEVDNPIHGTQFLNFINFNQEMHNLETTQELWIM